MDETLRALADHLTDERAAPRIAVWAHNSHLGDARATAMTGWGELNLGQYEALLHDWGQPKIALLTAADCRLRGPRLQRAIGVVYRPDRAREPLRRSRPAASVRRAHPPRRDDGGRLARARRGLGARRATRHVPFAV